MVDDLEHQQAKAEKDHELVEQTAVAGLRLDAFVRLRRFLDLLFQGLRLFLDGLAGRLGALALGIFIFIVLILVFNLDVAVAVSGRLLVCLLSFLAFDSFFLFSVEIVDDLVIGVIGLVVEIVVYHKGLRARALTWLDSLAGEKLGLLRLLLDVRRLAVELAKS